MVASTPPLLEHHHNNGVVQLTLNRPKVANALSITLYRLLAQALNKHNELPSTRLIVLTGNGRTFCGGMDLHQTSTISSGLEITSAAREFMHALLNFSKPVIAAVFGGVTGIGVTMLLHCDVVLAAGNSTFETPFAQVGIVPEFGSSSTFKRLGGVGKKLLMEGKRVSLDEMEQAGVVERGGEGREAVVKAAVKRGEEWSGRCNEEQWEMVRMAKRLIWAVEKEEMERVIDREFEQIDRQIECGIAAKLIQKKLVEMRRARM